MKTKEKSKDVCSANKRLLDHSFRLIVYDKVHDDKEWVTYTFFIDIGTEIPAISERLSIPFSMHKGLKRNKSKLINFMMDYVKTCFDKKVMETSKEITFKPEKYL